MRILNLFLLLIIIFALSCSTTETANINTINTKISYYKNSAEIGENGQLLKCKLDKPQIINGYTCSSWLHFYENGNVDQFETNIEITKQKFVIPKGSIIFLTKDIPQSIKTIWFSKDVIYDQKILINGGIGKISTEFYINGNLKSCYLVKDQNIQGYNCKSSLFHSVIFDEKGSLLSATIASDTTINSIFLKEGERIMIENNKLNQP